MPHTLYGGHNPAIGAAQEKALNDYASVVGRLARVKYLLGYFKDDPHSNEGRQDLLPAGGVLVRVTETPLGDIIGRVCDSHLDTEWELELAEDHPDLREYDGFHTFGTSYDLKTGEGSNDSGWELIEVSP